MKNWWLIPLVAVIAFVLGRLSVEPKVVTETVIEYHSINTSAVAPSMVSEPIGTKIERVKLIYLREDIGEKRQEIDKICQETVTDSNAFVTAELPIRDYTFTDDSTYTITARGVYVESLPQIQLYPRTTTTQRTETIVRTPRVSHGIQMGGGLALTPKGFQPAIYFGYGLTIKF